MIKEKLRANIIFNDIAISSIKQQGDSLFLIIISVQNEQNVDMGTVVASICTNILAALLSVS